MKRQRWLVKLNFWVETCRATNRTAKDVIPDSGSELKSPQSSNWIRLRSRFVGLPPPGFSDGVSASMMRLSWERSMLLEKLVGGRGYFKK